MANIRKAMNLGANDFDPILDDYAFFEAHSAEAEADLRAYARYLPEINSHDGTVRLLDFGGGTGSFTSAFLQRAGWPPEKLALTLVEPGPKASATAARRLAPVTAHPIACFPELPSGLSSGFDLILANHALYWVPDLAETVDSLHRCLRPGGIGLLAMAGRENALIQCWTHGYERHGKPIPYYTGEDLAAVLESRRLPFRQEQVEYAIDFPNSTENRLKILRFLFGKDLSGLPTAHLLAFFDPYLRGHDIRIDTRHLLFIV